MGISEIQWILGVEAMGNSPLIEQGYWHHSNLESQIKSLFRFTKWNGSLFEWPQDIERLVRPNQVCMPTQSAST